MTATMPEAREVALLELLDRVVDHGVVIAGDITISVADVDLSTSGFESCSPPSSVLRSSACADRRSPEDEVSSCAPNGTSTRSWGTTCACRQT